MLKRVTANPRKDRLRVAIVTASMGMAGAEKQAFYIARALSEAGADVRVYNLSRGGEYSEALSEMGVQSHCFGGLPGVPLRLAILVAQLRNFRPNVVQSVHAYTNIYSALAGRVFGAVSIGGLRSDVDLFLAENGRFARQLLTWPDAIAVNSNRALEQVKKRALVSPDRAYLLPNAIEVDAYPVAAEKGSCTAIYIGRLMPGKRVDVFLRALALARQSEPRLKGLIAGYGTETDRLNELARELGLLPEALRTFGFRDDVASLMRDASMFVFCSESEGTPNVILEAMAAGLPVITTAAGDAAELVGPAEAGLIVPIGNVEATAEAMVKLARSEELRNRMGRAGRNFVQRTRSCADLAGRLMAIYARAARLSGPGGRADILKRIREVPE